MPTLTFDITTHTGFRPLKPQRTPMARSQPTPPDSSSSWLLANNPSSSTPRLGLDRAVVVTGVSKGIGAAIARELAAKGCHVFGSVRRPGDAASLTDALGPAKFTPLVFDITDTVAVAAAVAVVDAALAGRTLFALVNNAGMHAGIDPAAAVTADTLRTQLEVNLVAPIAVTQAFLPMLGTDRTRAGVPGRVVMMSSVYGNYAVPWNGAYSASKFGLEGISQCLRRELAIYRIGVTIMRPGPVRSDIWADSMAAGDGCWTAHDGTDWEGPLKRSRKYLNKQWSNPAWFYEPEKIAAATWRALTAKTPPPAVVCTPNWLENWFLPLWAPTALVDAAVAAKFGLARVLPRLVGGGKAE